MTTTWRLNIKTGAEEGVDPTPFDSTGGTMALTEKHIECAHLCARLEVGGQDTKVMVQKCGVTRATI